MARITGTFNETTIRAFRGVLDFYVWRGLMCVRAWPRKPTLPRSPAVQATAQNFADNSRALSDLPEPFRTQALEDTAGSEWTWKDLWTTAIYGNLLFDPSVRRVSGEQAMIIRLASAPSAGTQNVNSTTYIVPNLTWTFRWPDPPFAPTQFRIQGALQASLAGQSITFQLATFAAPSVPLSALGNDLTVSNTPPTYAQSALLEIPSPPAPGTICAVAMKGSNSIVDLFYTLYEIELVQP